jgi:hypothetical protein
VASTRVARFFLVQNTKTGKNIPNYYKLYQMSIKYNKRPLNWPSVHKIYQQLPLQDPPRFTQIWIFGLKTNHLAALASTAVHYFALLVRRPAMTEQKSWLLVSVWVRFCQRLQLFYNLSAK